MSEIQFYLLMSEERMMSIDKLKEFVTNHNLRETMTSVASCRDEVLTSEPSPLLIMLCTLSSAKILQNGKVL